MTDDRSSGGASRDAYQDADILDGLPPDLAALLRDPSIIVPQDAAVFELIAKSMDAPSDTASAMSVDEWRQAWSVTCRRMLDAQAECERLRAELDAMREKDAPIRDLHSDCERCFRERCCTGICKPMMESTERLLEVIEAADD